VKKVLLLACLAASPSIFAQGAATVDGITFFDEENRIYVPIRDVADKFGWPAGYDPKSGNASINKRRINGRIRLTHDGKPMVSIQTLSYYGVKVDYDSKKRLATLRKKVKPNQMFYVRNGEKRVVVNKQQNMLAAWQGKRVVFRNKVTYGTAGKQTPNGIFKMQGYRNKMHRSSLYNNAPMSYAVQIVGNIFIHGFPETPEGPGSNGCIRLPIKDAQWFYYWIEQGTPVFVSNKWPKGVS
jgi:lipoprotein-anchoring transpeptidase ErfK/SrfK